MTVLVTGASGFVGRHLVAALLARGCQVRAVARRQAPARALPWFDRVGFVAADIHDPRTDVAALCEGVDALVHLAWPGLPNYQGLFHLEHNLMADYRFIKHAVEAGVGQVQVTGTCFEYGMQSGPLSETLECRPANAYGLAKHSLHLFLDTLRQQFATSAQNKGLAFSIDLAEDLPDRINGDPGKLAQCLDCLLDNAFKFTHEGSVRVRVVGVPQPDGTLRLTFIVTDTGIGFAYLDEATLYQRFFQLDGSTTRQYGGMGIGLAICRQLIELLGGRLTHNSEPRRGTRFQL